MKVLNVDGDAANFDPEVAMADLLRFGGYLAIDMETETLEIAVLYPEDEVPEFPEGTAEWEVEPDFIA